MVVKYRNIVRTKYGTETDADDVFATTKPRDGAFLRKDSPHNFLA